MDLNNRKVMYRWIVFIFAILLITNVANYYLFSRHIESASDDNGVDRIIRYVPGEAELDPEIALFWEAYDSMVNRYIYPLEPEVLIEGAIKGMVESAGDPYTRYYDSKALEEHQTQDLGSYGGLGIRVIEVNQRVIVFEVFEGSPAERSSLNRGDQIISADSYELTGQGIDRAVELLRGPVDTTVDLLVKKPGIEKPVEIIVERAVITVSTVFSKMLEDGLGYIKISNFDSNTAMEFYDKFQTMEQSGLSKGVILDLRNNYGGRVEQAVEVARLLIPEGEIARVVGRNDELIRSYFSTATDKPYPIVVLINEGSASATELLAGAFKDREAALLVGKKTFGKALVQRMEQLSGDNAIYMSVGTYFTPSGYEINKQGIEPDYEVDIPDIFHLYKYFYPGRLFQGDYGPDVEVLQLILEQLGYNIEISGYFDENTAYYVSSFQKSVGLEATGELDDITCLKLHQIMDEIAWDQDSQLEKALELIKTPELWNN